eukprot:1224466-Pyramimonas_sp.AAC.1
MASSYTCRSKLMFISPMPGHASKTASMAAEGAVSQDDFIFCPALVSFIFLRPPCLLQICIRAIVSSSG